MRERYNSPGFRGKRQRARGEGIEGSGRLAPSRTEERAEERAIEVQLGAFADGKDAAQRGTSPAECPARWRALASTWLRGWTFEVQQMSGKRPIDTVRVKP